MDNVTFGIKGEDLAMAVTPDPALWELVLREEQAEWYLKLPAFLMLGILMAIGVPGNLFVLAVYGLMIKPSSYRVFVLCMAVFDLLNCMMGIPFEIADLNDDITFDQPGVCKAFRFIVTFTSCASVIVLVGVSIDRFRRTCLPLSPQWKPTQSYKACALATLLALLYAIPAPIFYGVKTEERHGYQLYDCSIDDHWGHGSDYVLAYNIVLFVNWITCIIILSVLYTLIVYKIRKQKKQLSSYSTGQNAQTNHNNQSGQSQQSHEGHIDHPDPSGLYLSTSRRPGRRESGKHPDDNYYSHSSATDATAKDVEKCDTVLRGNVNFESGGQQTVKRSSGGHVKPGDVGRINQWVEDNKVTVLSSHGEADSDSEGSRHHCSVGDAAPIMRLFSRDVNPLQQDKPPGQTLSLGVEIMEPVYEDDQTEAEGLNCSVGDDDIFASGNSSQRVSDSQAMSPSPFHRHESLNNYYTSATNTPDGSMDCLSCPEGHCDDDTQEEGAIAPSGRGFELTLTTVEFHSNTNPTLTSSSSLISDSSAADGNVSSVSHSALWGSDNALDSDNRCLVNYEHRESIPLEELSPSYKTEQCEINSEPEHLDTAAENREGEHTFCLDNHRPWASEDCILEKGTEKKVGLRQNFSSLPFLTKELRRIEFEEFSMRRARSLPSLLYAGAEPGTYNRLPETKRENADQNCSNHTRKNPFNKPEYNDDEYNSTSLAPAEADNRVEEPQKQNFLQKVSQSLTLSRLSLRKPSNSNRDSQTIKVVYTMLAVTIGFILSYLPHLSVQIFRGFAPEKVEYMLKTSQAYFVIHHIFIRSFFVNNAINPIIYGTRNKVFRRKGLKLLRSIVAALIGEGRCGEKLSCGRCREWAVAESKQPSSHTDEHTQ
ncbi:cholecystokinin receptor [Plakobranchus ocellatus]|uniref:Cholecystokinin receptor n=1 Tax=Plakobranchus ocellatus TaxID=259542 RepID=A0AAV3YP72_9GAST|nr:cholecystokinin receptor [Plakobranchus ocellatus]